MGDRSRLINALMGIAFAALLSACATHREPPPEPTAEKPSQPGYKVGNPYRIGGVWYYPKEDPNYLETGEASWYGQEFHGKPTANGERYDMNALTAAHRTLPMPSHVRVTNLENGRSLVLRVNDRGPFAKNRIIDVSRRAAQLLGFETQGVTRVRVQAVARETSPREPLAPVSNAPQPPPSQASGGSRMDVETAPLPALSASTSAGRLFIQVGAFGEAANAREAQARAKRFGDASITTIDAQGQPLYRVRIGPMPNVEEADKVLSRIVAEGFTMAMIVVE